MKRIYVTTVLTCLAAVLVFLGLTHSGIGEKGMGTVTVGFIYEDDESAPYTYNFARAEELLRERYPDSVTVLSHSNVPGDEAEEPLRDLVQRGCRILFTNCHSENIIDLAPEYPDVQFCQVGFWEDPPRELPENYHTFNGEIYQGRYVSGIAAGLKLRSLIDSNAIAPEEALVGYVAAYPVASVISGYTAFLLGIRSVAPEAVMKVKYTGSWGSYSAEKACAKELIDAGCIVLSQHSDTIGPAIVCEENASGKELFFIGYNQSMLDVAPTTALVSTRINWTPYVLSAVAAVLGGDPIESVVDGNLHGNDVSAGFDRSWVELLDLNPHIAVEGTQQAIDTAISKLERDPSFVFKGDYIGVDPEDPSNTFDLSNGFWENKDSSSPAFRYVLQDVIEVLE